MDINQIRQEIEKLCKERDQTNQLELTKNEGYVTDKLVRPMIEQVLGYNASDPSSMLISQYQINAKESLNNYSIHRTDKM